MLFTRWKVLVTSMYGRDIASCWFYLQYKWEHVHYWRIYFSVLSSYIPEAVLEKERSLTTSCCPGLLFPVVYLLFLYGIQHGRYADFVSQCCLNIDDMELLNALQLWLSNTLFFVCKRWLFYIDLSIEKIHSNNKKQFTGKAKSFSIWLNHSI